MRRALLMVACIAMLFLATGARASEFDRKTTITFNQSVELPGIVLPAGTYVFKLLELPGMRDVVRVTNSEENHVYTTLMGISDLKMKAYEKTWIGFTERPVGAPLAIHEWFYPGDNTGLEFVYR